METKDIIGKEFTTFAFGSDDKLKFDYNYDDLIGLPATVLHTHKQYSQYANVEVRRAIGTTKRIHFPTEGIKAQLEEMERKKMEEEEEALTIDDILNNIKNLTQTI